MRLVAGLVYLLAAALIGAAGWPLLTFRSEVPIPPLMGLVSTAASTTVVAFLYRRRIASATSEAALVLSVRVALANIGLFLVLIVAILLGTQPYRPFDAIELAAFAGYVAFAAIGTLIVHFAPLVAIVAFGHIAMRALYPVTLGRWEVNGA